MPTRNNRDILTGGSKYRQKQERKFGIDEVVFDKDSRKEFLTGFHKRKVERKKKAIKFNQEQEKLARVEARKIAREEKQREFESKLRELDAAKSIDLTEILSKENDEEEWKGFEDDTTDEKDQGEQPIKGILHRKETFKVDDPEAMGDAVVDEETTVTVDTVENPYLAKVGTSSLDRIAQSNYVNLAKSEEILEKSIDRAKKYAVICGVSKPVKQTQKKKKFRYLTKGERRDNNRKAKLSKAKSRNRD